jgi:hypothetical protein
LAAASFQNTPPRKGNMTPKQILVKPRAQFFHKKKNSSSRFSAAADRAAASQIEKETTIDL